jgi:hypothetical protein
MMSVYKDEHIFKSLNEYMFTTKNISRLHDNVFISQSPQKISNTLEQLCKKKKTVPNNVGDAQVEDLYYPKQHDKLFWSFYIFLHGKIEYDYTTHIFETEKKYKIQSVEKLRDMKALLRQHKLKYADIEKELVSLPKITIKGLHALCILYKVSITYVSGNIYYILGNTNEDAAYKNCVIVTKTHSNSKSHSQAINTSTSHTRSNLLIGLQLEATDTYITNISQSRIRIKNYNKPMLSIASYTLPVLHEMANILNINIYDDNGKKKLKKQLYQDVSEKIL